VRKGRVPLRFLAVLALALVSACGNDDSEDEGTPPRPGAAEVGARTIALGPYEADDHGELDVTGRSRVEIEAGDFYFEPTVVAGTPGQKLTVHVTNVGTVSHTVTSPGIGIDETVGAGRDVEFSIVLPHGGQIVYFCSFHVNGGMAGGLRNI
jgi:plastocyanin